MCLFRHTLFLADFFFSYNFSNVELLFCCVYDIFAVPSLDWMSYKHFFSLVPSQALLKPAAPAFLDSLGRLDPEELQVDLVSKASAVHALTWLVSVSTRSNMRFRIVKEPLATIKYIFLPKCFSLELFQSVFKQKSTSGSPLAASCPSDSLTLYC